MENKEDDIENLFQQRFANDEADVSPRVWQNIKKTLPEDKGSTGSIFSQNVVLWSITVILIMSTVSGSIVLLNKNNSDVSRISLSSDKKDSVVKEENGVKRSRSDIHTINDPIKSNGEGQPLLSKTHTNAESISQSEKSNVLVKNSNSPVWSNDASKQKTSEHTTDHLSWKKNTSNLRSKGSTTSIESNDQHFASTRNESFQSIDKRHHTTKNEGGESKNKNYSSKQNTRDDSASFAAQHTARNKENLVSASGDFAHQKDAQHEQLHPTNNTKSILSDTDNAISQKSQVEDSGLSDNKFFLLASDTIHQKKNTALSLDSNYPAKEKPDSLFTSKDAPFIPSDRGSLTSDRATGNDSSAFNSNIVNIQKDSSTHTNLTSPSQNDNRVLNPTDSTNDHLASSSAFTDDARDTLIEPKDTIHQVNQDSVLIEEATKKEKRKSIWNNRLSFDAVVSLLMTGSSTKATDSLYQSAVENKNKNDKPGLGYSAGIIANYKMSDRIHVSAGAIYTTFSEEYKTNYTLKKFDWVYIDSTWQQIESDSINRDIKVKDKYSFLSIPLQLSYTFLLSNKLHLSATAGLRSNILLKGVTYLPNANNSDVKEIRSGFNSLSFSYLLSLEAEYKLSEHTALLFQPTFIYGASSIHSKASALIQKPYGIGLTIGMRFIF